LGDLIEACRLVALAAAPFIPTAAPRALAQLGYEYAYGADGNVPAELAHGPALLDELRWGAHGAEAGRVATAEPLFPRIETESATRAAG
jgi:methionyl-tRNA synthetase